EWAGAPSGHRMSNASPKCWSWMFTEATARLAPSAASRPHSSYFTSNRPWYTVLCGRSTVKNGSLAVSSRHANPSPPARAAQPLQRLEHAPAEALGPRGVAHVHDLAHRVGPQPRTGTARRRLVP